MIRSIKSYLVAFLLCASPASLASVNIEATASSIQDIEHFLINTTYKPQEILIAFDIDKTILKKFPYFRLSSLSTLFFPDDTYKESTFFERLNLITYATPTEKNTVPFIEFCKNQGYEIVALTARSPVLASCTQEHFEQLNLILSPQFIEEDEQFALDLEYPASYQNGVIYAGKNDKGDALDQFMEIAEFEPKLLIFIDDLKHNVYAVKKMARVKQIDFVGLHYQPHQNIKIAQREFNLEKNNAPIINA